jgi:hypothetical protein
MVTAKIILVAVEVLVAVAAVLVEEAHEPHLQFKATTVAVVLVAVATQAAAVVAQAAAVAAHPKTSSQGVVEVVAHQASLERP